MTECDNWVVLFINGPDPHYRVLCGSYGGYLGSDSWQMNSGITGVVEDGEFFYFSGYSGSTYRCHKENYQLSRCTRPTYEQLRKQYQDIVILMDEDTDWSKQNWIIK